MKTIYNIILLVTVLVFLSSGIIKAGSNSTVNSEVKNVTVFLNGAQIERKAAINYKIGTTTVIFDNLPQALNPQTIQVSGTGSFTILSVTHQINYLKGQQKSKEILLLEDTLKTFEYQLNQNNNLLEVYKQEEFLLTKNMNLGGINTGVDINQLKAASEFYRLRLREIKSQSLDISIKNEVLNSKIEKIKNQIEQLGSAINIPTSEVLITISSVASGSGTLILSYYFQNAGWIPQYDVRASQVNDPIQMIYKASVYQSTGENWENVNLTLSTGNPSLSGEKPLLMPWYVDFYTPYMYDKKSYNQIAYGAGSRSVLAKEDEYSAMEIAESAPGVVVNEGQTSVEFDITVPYDIASDGNGHMVEIQNFNLPAQYEYYCAPKLDRDAFLIAKITDWANYNLLPGEINIYFEGTYIGKSYLNNRNTSDTLMLSLGRDKAIMVTRIMLKDFEQSQTIGSNIKKTKSWEVSIRNNKKQAIHLVLEDQFPVSANKDIVVEALETSGALYDNISGKLQWKVALQPNEKTKYKLTYSIKYPKDKIVNLE